MPLVRCDLRQTDEQLPHVEDQANAGKLCKSMGEPDYLRAYQVEALRAGSERIPEPRAWTRDGDALVVDLDLPAHAVAFIILVP